MNSVFSGVGWTDVAEIGNSTASGANAEPDNLLTDRRAEFWRTASNQSFAFANIDLGETRPINSIGVLDIFGPLDSEMLITVRVADTEAELTTNPAATFAFDVPVPLLVDGSRQFFNTRSGRGLAPVQTRWVRIEIEHVDAATTLLGASRVVVSGPGSEYIPDHGVSVGSDVVTPSSESDVTETDSGSVFVRHLFTRRVASPQLRFQKNDSYLDPGGLWDLLAFSGSNRPILFSQEDIDYAVGNNNERVSRQIVYGRIPDPDPVRAESANHRSVTLEMQEWT